jgi:hypothetical protein
MPSTRIPHMAGLIVAARIICRIYTQYGTKIMPFLDVAEAAALATLGAACTEFLSTLPIQDE